MSRDIEETPLEMTDTIATDQSGVSNRPARRKSLWRNGPIASLLLAVAVSFFGFGLVAPLRTLFARSEGASGGEVGLMAAAYLFSAFIFLFPFGWLSDRYSRIALIVGGLTAHCLIALAYLGATSGELFIALRFLEGASSAAVIPAARALLADLVPEGRNGEAFGMMSAGMTFGLLGGPPIGTFLAQSLGYITAYLTAAGVFLPAIALILYTFRKSQPTHHATRRTTVGGKTKGSIITPPIIVGCIVRVALGIGPGLATAIWSVYMADLGFALTLIGWTYTVYAIPMVLVAPSAGRLSDRFGRTGMMFGASLLLALVWLGYGLTSSFVLFCVLGVVEGSLDAVARSANDGYLADHSPAESRGRAQALFNAAQQFGSLIGAIGAGFLYEFSHPLPFFAMGGIDLFLISGALLVAILFYRRKRLAFI